LNHPELLTYGKADQLVLVIYRCAGCGKFKRKNSVSIYCLKCLGLHDNEG